MKQQRYALGAVVVAALLPFFGWATDSDTPGGPAGRLKPGPNGPFRTKSMSLQATGGEGKVDLIWMQNDFELLAGYNLYRWTSANGSFSRINAAPIPAQVHTFTDTNVTPGLPYLYKFTVVKTDIMGESDFSNVAQGTPLDTIPPVITHTPVTSAATGIPLTLFADATDNVAVQAVTLRFRTIGTTDYTARTMTRTTGNAYAATIEGSRLVSPGVEYYIEASDGISTVRSGRPEYPWQVIVVDRPVVNVVTPNHGTAAGGTFVTIAGSNFKTDATVSFGGMPASSVTVVSASQITCTNAAHFPAAVDVAVRNPDTQSGTLLLGYTYQSAVASLSLPNTGGPRYGTVQVPINAANVQGLAAASLAVTFDPAVLRRASAHTGSLTPGWYLAPGTNTPGQLRLSMASPGSTSTGSGVLAYAEFEVLGAPGATCPLTLTSVSLNDGAIQTETAAGSFAVNVVYAIRGTVSFWNGGAAVPGVLCTLQGDRVYTGTSGSNGTFTVACTEAGNHTLTPGKTNDTPAANGVTTLDISLIRRHILAIAALDSPYKLLAADVNCSGSDTTLDITLIRRVILGITNVFPCGLWRFVPAAYVFPDPLKPWSAPGSIGYTNILADHTNESFVAIKLGDVNNSWTPPAGGKGLATLGAKADRITAKGLGQEVTFAVSSHNAQPGETVTASVSVSGFRQVTSAQFAIEWDPAVLRFVGTGGYDLNVNVTAGNFGTPFINSGKLTFSWDDPNAAGVTVADGTVVFTVSFVVAGSTGSASRLALVDVPTVREVAVNFEMATFGSVDGHVQTPPVSLAFGPAEWLPHVGVRLTLLGSVTGSVSIRWTGDVTNTLSNWPTLIWFTNFSGSTQYIDSAATNFGTRFYRAVTP